MSVDRYGVEVVKGARAILLGVSEELLRGLPEEDQAAIQAAVGKPGEVAEVLPDGSAEFEIPEVGGQRTIWVPCADLCIGQELGA